MKKKSKGSKFFYIFAINHNHYKNVIKIVLNVVKLVENVKNCLKMLKNGLKFCKVGKIMLRLF